MRRLCDRRGAAALEFALVTPVLIILLLSLYDVSNAVIVWWQMSAAADAIARLATSLAAAPNGTNVLSTDNASTASTAIFAVMPELANGGTGQYGVTISSVVMAPTVAGCTTGCTYTGTIAWSLALQGQAALRPCGPPGQVADGSPASLTTLPVDAFTAAPLLVVDVSYNFLPLFNTVFGSGLALTESAYMATRTGTDAAWVQLTGPRAAQAKCPGFP